MKLERLSLEQTSFPTAEIEIKESFSLMGLQIWDFGSRLVKLTKGHLDTVLCKAKHLLFSCNSSFPLNYVYNSDEQ